LARILCPYAGTNDLAALLLSSTGLAYRRCSLAWVNGAQIGVKFLWQNGKKASRRFYYEPVSLIG
jgi:hypothetical protein